MADYPDTLRYTKDHEWARIDGAVAVVGITFFAKDQLGDVVFLELPAEGTQLKKGDPFGVVESTKAVSELFAPVSGRVVKVNTELAAAPDGVNEDPHGRGWMVEIQMSSPAEADEMLTAAQYKELAK